MKLKNMQSKKQKDSGKKYTWEHIVRNLCLNGNKTARFKINV